MNMGGLFIIAIGAFIVIMGIRGSQHVLFPGLFGQHPATIPGVTTASVDSNGDCGQGFVKVPIAGGTTVVCVKV